ncbi:MAG: 3-demethylubiquinone-9 3-methyltransferase, partial [Microbacterium sp.]|nr:3-demethylubiquinone-9 3-methyltransferase [Microbacterium sp.]
MLRLNPYLSFRAEAREAMEFYRSVLGGELQIDTFEGYDDMGIPADEA